MAHSKPDATAVQLNVRVSPDMLAWIDAEVKGIEKREGIEATRSQVVVYMLKLARKIKARPPIV